MAEKDKDEKAPAPSRYPLRVDVAKPAVVYQPSFGKDKDKDKDAPKPSPSRPEGSSVSPGGSAQTPRERVLGKRRRGGRTEFLVKRPGESESTWESSKSVSARAVQEFEEKRQSRQLLQSRLATAKQAKPSAKPSASKPSALGPAEAATSTEKMTPHRILAQRRLEGGQRYLIHWVGQSVTNASWESAKRLNNPALVHEFEQAVSHAHPHLRARKHTRATPSRHPLATPPRDTLCDTPSRLKHARNPRRLRSARDAATQALSRLWSLSI